MQRLVRSAARTHKFTWKLKIAFTILLFDSITLFTESLFYLLPFEKKVMGPKRMPVPFQEMKASRFQFHSHATVPARCKHAPPPPSCPGADPDREEEAKTTHLSRLSLIMQGWIMVQVGKGGRRGGGRYLRWLLSYQPVCSPPSPLSLLTPERSEKMRGTTHQEFLGIFTTCRARTKKL
jgi:hypothetical protein